MKQARKRPLAGIRIVDFSNLLPGPMATLILQEAGAEVLKIERPQGGDELRAGVPKWGDSHTSLGFALLNTGKRSLAVDVKSPAERERLLPLLQEADLLVEQFRPGVMERLGLGYETVQKLFDRQLRSGRGSVPALPVPLDRQFLGDRSGEACPSLGEGNTLLDRHALQPPR